MLQTQLSEAGVDQLNGNSEIAIVDDDPGFSFMLKDYLVSSGQMQARFFPAGKSF